MKSATETIRVNSILEEFSVCDGPGLRIVIFLQGCNFHCPGCHNKSTWELNGGTEYEIADIAGILRKKTPNKKLTISGGEPLLQAESVLALCEALPDFDLCLYTGHELHEVPKEILKHLHWIKCGQFQKSKWSATLPFVGSSNQKFIEINKNFMEENHVA